jgi:hypothetical protein
MPLTISGRSAYDDGQTIQTIKGGAYNEKNSGGSMNYYPSGSQNEENGISARNPVQLDESELGTETRTVNNLQKKEHTRVEGEYQEFQSESNTHRKAQIAIADIREVE